MSNRVPRIVGAGWRSTTKTGKINRIQMAFTKENVTEFLAIAQAQFKAGGKYAYFDIYPNTRRLNDKAPEYHLTAYVQAEPEEDDIFLSAQTILNSSKES